MNIDEERAAFDKWQRECMERGHFPSWYAAKAQAEEAVKPILSAVVEKGIICAFEGSYFCVFCDESNSEAEHIFHGKDCAYVKAKREPPKPKYEVIQLKGSGRWHICRLEGRIWRGIDDQCFKREREAVKWARDNGYVVE